MKQPLNYFGYAFSNPAEDYNQKFLKTKKGKKEIKKEKKYNKKLRKELKQNGFDKSECWNLYITIAKFILPRLKYFRETTISYPDNDKGMDGWHEILDKMIYSFDEILKDDSTDQDKIQEGLELFAKYYTDLWI